MRSALSVFVAAGALLIGIGPGSARGEAVYTEGNGRLSGIRYDGDTMPIESDVVVATSNWTHQASLASWDINEAGYSETNGARQWSGRIRMDVERSCRYEQTVRESEGQADIDLSVTAEADLERLAGVYLVLRFPVDVFAGGACEARGTNAQPRRAVLPRDMPTQSHLLADTADQVTVADEARQKSVVVSLEGRQAVTFQDDRKWNLPRYALLVRFSTNSVLRKGEAAATHFSIRVTGKADHGAVRLRMDPKQVLYVLDGFGGNFVYSVRSPVTRFNLDTLRIAWARTQMSLADWEPENDDDSPTNTNWRVLEGRDVPGSTLRYEFTLDQELQKQGIPYVVSVWDLPEWMYEDPGRGREAYGRRIAPGKWDELLESIASYLLYAKRRYGVEPALFSFNECREGVRVQLSAEEHRDAIKRIGSHLEALGLKTAMLLADNASPRGTQLYAIPTTEDPAAMRYVGALSMHSWGGATPEQYAAWGDLARAIGKPLLVSELGVDGMAWHTPWVLRTFHYALQEAGMYQDILLHARPQGTMEWEFTGDYAIADEAKQADGTTTVVPGWRYSFIRQFCNLTPAKAQALATESGSATVQFTAFAGATTNGWVQTLHIVNMGASRTATLSGVPRDVSSFRAILTSEDGASSEREPVRVRRGRLSVSLPAQSLLTLTTER